VGASDGAAEMVGASDGADESLGCNYLEIEHYDCHSKQIWKLTILFRHHLYSLLLMALHFEKAQLMAYLKD
jgi:hypothetical protein